MPKFPTLTPLLIKTAVSAGFRPGLLANAGWGDGGWGESIPACPVQGGTHPPLPKRKAPLQKMERPPQIRCQRWAQSGPPTAPTGRRFIRTTGHTYAVPTPPSPGPHPEPEMRFFRAPAQLPTSLPKTNPKFLQKDAEMMGIPPSPFPFLLLPTEVGGKHSSPPCFFQDPEGHSQFFFGG